MADISMQSDSMLALKLEAMKLKTEFENLQKNLDKLVNDLDGEWKGNAQVEFATGYSKIKPKLTSIGKMFDSFSQAVSDVITNEEALIALATDAMNNLSF